ncbi:hypothetical protein [Streptomyces sp. NPDC001820]|uniref:hypothetical protein n=1 Tax=Streptomyces sp. NPDC001820 TaxID=3364613 RepID=UPI0036AD45AD
MTWAVKRALATLVAVLFLTVPLVGASTGGGNVPDWLDRTAREVEAREHRTLVVTVRQTLALGEGDVRTGMERVVGAKKKDVRLVVVQTGLDSGPGGAVLLLLADSAVVPRDARVSTLPPDVLQSARKLRLCDRPRDGLCQLLERRDGQPVQVETGLLGSDPRMAPDEKAALQKAGHLSNVEPHRLLLPSGEDADGPGLGPAGMLLLTLLAAGAALFVLAVLRTRYRLPSVAGPAPTAWPAPVSWPAGTAGPMPAPPRRPPSRSWAADQAEPGPGGQRAVPDGPVRPATVRTRLHPQGYVELDGWLYRASWAEPYLDPPAPDATVDVSDRRPGLLLAYSPANSRH